jgi:2-polyprenyl-6-methoxyphenol hydroxylase-like FAD-dependent oxidoreductase
MNTDVLIVGAGPTGLMLAYWLARLGIHPLVIDKKVGPIRESRALAVQARTLETYDTLGIVQRALPQGVRVAAVNILLRQHRVGRIELGEIGRALSPYPYLLVMGQDKTEHLLLEHYLEQGGQVRWESEHRGLKQDDEGVRADLRRADGQAETVRVRYACGCDGAVSGSQSERHSEPYAWPPDGNRQRPFSSGTESGFCSGARAVHGCLDDQWFWAERYTRGVGVDAGYYRLRTGAHGPGTPAVS